jgi:hypothetical protein
MPVALTPPTQRSRAHEAALPARLQDLIKALSLLCAQNLADLVVHLSAMCANVSAALIERGVHQLPHARLMPNANVLNTCALLCAQVERPRKGPQSSAVTRPNTLGLFSHGDSVPERTTAQSSEQEHSEQ